MVNESPPLIARARIGFSIPSSNRVVEPQMQHSAPPEFWYDAALAVRQADAEAYFISCANIHSMEVIERLENELGKPVITSNQAALWCALRELGIHAPGPGMLS